MLKAMVDVNEQPMTRQEKAAATRRRILTAAQELFAEHGYAATTMQAIADRAGVAVQTVYFVFHTKGELLRQLLQSLGGRDDEPLETMDRDWVHEAMTDPSGQRSLALMVEHGNDIFARVAPLSSACGQGAAAEPDFAEVWQGIVRQRREGIRQIVHSLADRDLLRPGLDPDRAADIVFGLQRPETFTAFVDECGWSIEAYKAWSYRLLCDQLLDPAQADGVAASPTRGLTFDAAPA